MKVRIKKSPKNIKALTPDTVQFSGPSHAEGGIPFMGVEVEGGETATKMPSGETVIFGNMRVPGTNKKFKDVSKQLADKEQRVNRLMAKGAALVQYYDPQDKWGELCFNAGKVMLEGGQMKAAELQQSKEHLGKLQDAMLATANELGLDPQAMSKGSLKKAKNGLRLYANGGDPTPWKFKNTKVDKLDPRILNFVKMVEARGWTGYSGGEGGYSERNTASGKPSRHSSNQALDMIFDDKEVYQKVLNDPEMVKYLIENGLTVINEYDPNIAKKTGATKGHLHVGFDYGTSTADDFRNKAKQLYGNQAWNWKASRIKNTATANKDWVSGDFQETDEKDILLAKKKIEEAKKLEFQFKPFTNKQKKQEPNRISPGDPYSTDVTPLSKLSNTSNAKKLSLTQILPELYTAATNKTEPVFAQQLDPQLYQPYQVSYQDQLNDNNTSFNAVARLSKNNPEALSLLAAQKYAADNKVRGEEFRINQQLEAEVLNKNIALLNDTQSKNLGLADQQYVRQETAKSNTKAINREVLNSITAKLKQNELEQQSIKLYENMYPYYRFDPLTGEAMFQGPGADESTTLDRGSASPAASNTSVTTITDGSGNLKRVRRLTPGDIDTAIKQQQYLQNTPFSVESIIKRLQKKNPAFKNGGSIQRMMKNR